MLFWEINTLFCLVLLHILSYEKKQNCCSFFLPLNRQMHERKLLNCFKKKVSAISSDKLIFLSLAYQLDDKWSIWIEKTQLTSSKLSIQPSAPILAAGPSSGLFMSVLHTKKKKEMNYLSGLDSPLSLKSLSFGFSGELKWSPQGFFTVSLKLWAPHSHCQRSLNPVVTKIGIPRVRLPGLANVPLGLFQTH